MPLTFKKGKPPTKYKKEYCKMLVSHMSKGHSMHSFPSVIHDKYGISVDYETLVNWSKKKQEFKDAKKLGEAKSLALLEKFLLMHVTGVVPEELKDKQNIPMDKGLLAFIMKCRFYKTYGESVKIEQTVIEDRATENPELKKVSEDALRKAKTILIKDYKKVEKN